jgi:hypothetical protein
MPSIKPLRPDVSALLEPERHAPDVARALQEEAWKRVSAALAGEPPKEAERRTRQAAAGRAFGRFGGPLLGLAIGVALGAWLHGRLSKPVVEVRKIEVPVLVAPSAAPLQQAPVAPAASSVQSTEAPSATAGSRPSPSSLSTGGTASRPDALAQERTLLDRARSALASGNTPAARAALAEHERAFARGMLTEEREFLAIQCAVREGRQGEARERATRFRSRFPSSALLSAIDESVGTPSP